METTIKEDLSETLKQKDAAFVWHPYHRISPTALPIPIAKAKGAHLIDYDGHSYFDAISSWWVTAHGHAHPAIAKRIAQQAEMLDQVIFADFTHAGAIELAERLVGHLSIGPARVFYSDNGSTAVEAALKMAMQYLHHHNQYARTKIICFQNAYHGDTFGAMSVSGRSHFTRPFWPYLFEVESIVPPYLGQEELSLKQMKQCLAKDDTAVFIFEPTVQGASGMLMHSSSGLDALLKLCQHHGVITIADEVMTGFGRTGPLFACHTLTCKPDIICLSKALTGGFLPLGATVCKQHIYNNFVNGGWERTLMHGHSYSGNPLACAAALASLDLFEQPECAHARKMIETHHITFKQNWSKHPKLVRCAVAGTILALEYKPETDTPNGYLSPLRDKLSRIFLSQHIFVRPLGNVVYLMPPYCTQPEELERVYDCIAFTLENN